MTQQLTCCPTRHPTEQNQLDYHRCSETSSSFLYKSISRADMKDGIDKAKAYHKEPSS